MKKSLFALSMGLTLAVLTAPAWAGDYIEKKYDNAISWLPRAPKSGDAPSADELAGSQITVVREDYDAIYYKFKIAGSTGLQHLKAASVVRVFYGDEPQLFASALASMNGGDYPKAISDFQSLVADQSQRSWVRMYSLKNIALCLQESSTNATDAKAGIAAWQKLLSTFPKSRFLPEAYINIGLAEMSLGKVAQAQAAFQKLQSTPDLPKASQLLGQYYLIRIEEVQGRQSRDSSKLKDAIQQYTDLLAQAQADPNLSRVATRARLGIGDCLLGLNQFHKAQDYFEKITESGSSEDALAGAYNGLGKCYLARAGNDQKKSPEDAKKEWKQALLSFLRTVVLYDQNDDQTAEALYNAGFAYSLWRGKDWKARAMGLWEECARRFPGTNPGKESGKAINSLR